MIIGITGKAGAGKDTMADWLVAKHGFVKVCLADAMKRAAMEWFGFTYAQMWGPSSARNAIDKRYVRVPAHEEECFVTDPYGHNRVGGGTAYVPAVYLTPRHVLQQLGTEFGRACYQNVWVDYAMRVARAVGQGRAYSQSLGLEDYGNPDRTNVVIPDVRFANELDAIKSAGGKLVKIVRPGAGLQGQAAAHKSETEQDGFPDSAFDFVVDNDGTLEHLAEFTRQVVENLKGMEAHQHVEHAPAV